MSVKSARRALQVAIREYSLQNKAEPLSSEAIIRMMTDPKVMKAYLEYLKEDESVYFKSFLVNGDT